MKDFEYYIIAILLLLVTSTGRTLDRIMKKEIKGKIGIISSFIFSLIGGSIAGMIASVYVEVIQMQWISIAAGSWMGERLLDSVAGALGDKIDMIFKSKNNEK